MAKKSYPSREERMKDLNQRLEQGIRDVFESERFRDYLAVMSRFHTYSARNVLLIHMQRPNATRVASAKRWKEQFERFINKGEKAIYIMAPIPIVKTVERQKLDPDTKAPVLDEDGQVITEKREVQVPRFRPVPVFDVSQTNGKPLPQLALRRTAPVPMEIKPMAENLDGYFSLDEQSISIRAGMSEVQTVCAAVHEITHSILHNQRGVREDKAVRTAQELEAESVSYVVCQYCGVETGANSFGYLASWSKDKELSELRACLATINKTANQLIGEIDRHFAEVCKERGIELHGLNGGRRDKEHRAEEEAEQRAVKGAVARHRHKEARGGKRERDAAARAKARKARREQVLFLLLALWRGLRALLLPRRGTFAAQQLVAGHAEYLRNDRNKRKIRRTVVALPARNGFV